METKKETENGTEMKAEKNKKKLPLHLILFYACVAVSFAVWLYVMLSSRGDFAKNRFTSYDIDFFNEGWTDEAGLSLEIPMDYPVTPGSDFSMRHVMTESTVDGTCLLFRTDHTFVRAYVNGEEVYSFGEKEDIPLGSSPGSGYQLVPVGRLAPGDEIMLVTNCPYEKYSGHLRTIRIGTKADLVSYVLRQGIGLQVMTFLPLLIGIFIMVLPPLFFRGYQISTFVNTGMSFVVLSLWSFSEVRSWQLFFNNNYAMQTLNFVLFALITPAALLSMRAMGFLQDSKIYRGVMCADVLVAFAYLLLQLTDTLDFFEALPMIHVMIILNGIIFAGVFLMEKKEQEKENAKKGKKSKKSLNRLIGVILYAGILVCGTLDMLDFYWWDYFGNGFFTRIELLALLFCCGVVAMKRGLALHMEHAEQKALERMAYNDNLTALKNRRRFDMDVEQIEKDGKEVSILYADMNGLKYINDNLGHVYGDNALKVIATQMKESFPKDDCYRLGGDEFCVLSFSQEPEVLEDVCEEINERLEAYEKAYNYPIGISHGASKYTPGTGTPIHQCLVEADRRMYEFKEELYKTRERYR